MIRRSDVSAGRRIPRGEISVFLPKAAAPVLKMLLAALKILSVFYGGKPIANFTAEYSG